MQLLNFSPILALFSFISSTSAQAPAQATLISNTLPACAQSCPTLIQAQSACVPPPLGAAAVTDQQTYTSCFCQSSYLTGLHSPGSAANAICPTCSPQDMSATQQWYSGLCSGGSQNGAPAPGNGQPTTTTPPPAGQTPTTTTTQASKATGARNVGGVTQDTSNSGKSWYIPPLFPLNSELAAYEENRISTHYRWVIMLIVLFLGLGALAFVGWWLHRRYQRRQELGGHDRTGQPDLGSWAPGQSVHEFGPPEAAIAAAGRAAQDEKGKGRVGVQDQGVVGEKRGSRRLKKGLFGRNG